jgi:hypothetical protein
MSKITTRHGEHFNMNDIQTPIFSACSKSALNSSSDNRRKKSTLGQAVSMKRLARRFDIELSAVMQQLHS